MMTALDHPEKLLIPCDDVRLVPELLEKEVARPCSERRYTAAVFASVGTATFGI